MDLEMHLIIQKVENMSNKENSRGKGKEDVKIVKELLSEHPELKYFSSKKLSRWTNGDFSTKRISIGLRYLHKQGIIERINRTTWAVVR